MPMCRVWRLTWAAVALAALLVVTGCGGRGEEEDGGNAAAGGARGGQPARGPGFDGRTIRLGALVPLTGRVADPGQDEVFGLQAWFEEVNARGGIAGRYPIEVVARDTRYEPPVAVQAYGATNRDVTMYGAVLGTQITQALLPRLSSDGLTAVPGSYDIEWWRDENLLPIGVPYQIQVANGIDYFLRENGADASVCTLTQDDAYGEAVTDGAEFAAEQLGTELAERAQFNLGAQDFTPQLNAIRRAGCDLTVFASAPGTSATILSDAAAADLDTTFLGAGVAWAPALAESPVIDYLRENVLIVDWNASPGGDQTPGMQRLLAGLKEVAPNRLATDYVLFGAVAGATAEAVLERAVRNGDLSREGIRTAMTQVGEVDLQGLAPPAQYTDVASREPARESQVFRPDPQSDDGLSPIGDRFTSEPAEQYPIDAQ